MAAVTTKSVAAPSVGVFREPVAHSPSRLLGTSNTCLGLCNSTFLGRKLAGRAAAAGRAPSRVNCVASLERTKPKDTSLMQEVEERWQRARQSPLEGVPFTYDEFADALSKYDFSFEVGDTVCLHTYRHRWSPAPVVAGGPAQ